MNNRCFVENDFYTDKRVKKEDLLKYIIEFDKKRKTTKFLICVIIDSSSVSC